MRGPFFLLMPWKIEERDGRHCVIRQPDGKVEKCHNTHGDAVKHMRALYANVHKSMNGFFVKQVEGVWHWAGVVTNNWLDKHSQIIMSKAHERFVEMIDSGEYGQIVSESPLVELPGSIGQLFKDIADRGTPDLWYWHLPAPIGYTTDVAFDKRGYLIAMGKQHEGEQYSSIFEAISKSDTLHGMSHGMPEIMVQFEMGKPDQIAGYISTEFTVLPDDEAANIGTTFSTQKKERAMQIPERKLKRMAKDLGEEAVAQIDLLLNELDGFAEEANIPRKEITMPDKSDAVVEEEVEEVEAEEVETEEIDAEDETVEDEVAASESEEEADAVREDAGTGMNVDPTEFQVPVDMKAFADEMIKGLEGAFANLAASQAERFDQLQKQLDNQADEIAQLKKAEGDRIAEKAAETPVASMSGWMATRLGSVIGTEGARLNGSEERGLYNKTKENEQEAPDSTLPFPETIKGFVSRQQAGQRMIVTPGSDDQTGR